MTPHGPSGTKATGAERKSQIWFGLLTGSPELGLRSVTLPRDFTDSWNVVRTNQQAPGPRGRGGNRRSSLYWTLVIPGPLFVYFPQEAFLWTLTSHGHCTDHWPTGGSGCTNRGKGTFRAGHQPTGLHHPPRWSQTHPPTLGFCPVGACSPGVQTDTSGEVLDPRTALFH